MPYLLAAILANLSYAVADNANGLAAKRNSSLQVAWWAGLVGIIAFLPLVLFFQDEILRLTWNNIAWIAVSSVLVIVGYWTFITGMHKGSITATGVIGGSFPAVTTIVALLFFNESISWWQAGAIGIILVGIVFTSIPTSFHNFWSELKSSSIIYAFATFLLWGVYYAVVRIPIDQVGWFLPQYGSNLLTLPIVLVISLLTKEPGITARPQVLKFVIMASILQVSGTLLFNYALSQGPTSIVAPIAGSSPAVFAALAFFVFKERLSRYQKIGIAITIAGIICLSFMSH